MTAIFIENYKAHLKICLLNENFTNNNTDIVL